MIRKPDKPANEVTSYRPISLLPALSKLFEKLLLKRLKPLIKLPDFQFGFRTKHSTVDQCHRVVSTIERALEEKKYCPSVFLDVSQAFDKVWHEGLICKIKEHLPGNMCELLQSYLAQRKFRVAFEDARSSFYNIQAGVPQGSVLGPTLYLLYTADIPRTPKTTLAVFADDTAILAVSDTQEEATRQLQEAVDKIMAWTRKWRIKLNKQKSVQVTFALRKRDIQHCIFINRVQIPQAETVKYLRLHLDSRLNWKHHVRQKAQQIRLKLREMYWLVGPYSQLKLSNKVLIYRSIIKPIWTYGAQLWGCTKQSNRNIIQRSQSKFLRAAVNAYRFTRNEDIHRDLGIKMVDEVIRDIAGRHERRLHRHENVLALQLLEDSSNNKRRLKRQKPYDLV